MYQDVFLLFESFQRSQFRNRMRQQQMWIPKTEQQLRLNQLKRLLKCQIQLHRRNPQNLNLSLKSPSSLQNSLLQVYSIALF